MPCNCAKPQEAYPENKEWGPLFWTVLHCLAEYAGKAPPMYLHEELQGWTILLKELQTILPCQECRAHYIQYYRENPLTRNNILINVRIWLFNLHNQINLRNNVAVFPLEQLSITYPGSILSENLRGLKITMDRAISLSGVKINAWNNWYSKVMLMRSYYGI